ncbi:MAG TPA: aminoglycoside phosphotransferase family protein, partial [Actinomycetota bacterium]|nr:aminoglycoside phosphotransferase family protein [Actinomycetota bacterium]
MSADISVPANLEWLRRTESGAAWLASLPTLFAECADRWSLEVGDPFPYTFASLAAPATTSDGTPVVLKIHFPDRESEHEARALEVWNGDGAVRLLAHDADRRALLLERCVPGTPLWEIGAQAALDVMVELLPRLWKPAGPPIRPLAEEAAWWASYLPDTWERAERPFERRLLDAALDALEVLPPTQSEQVLVHQ